MFNFAKKRIKEIEKWVEFCYMNDKAIDQQRITKLDNEGAAQTVPKIQKELLQGRYQIKLKDEMPYNEKILRIAQEPVAFHLYKNRDFYILDPKSVG